MTRPLVLTFEPITAAQVDQILADTANGMGTVYIAMNRPQCAPGPAREWLIATYGERRMAGWERRSVANKRVRDRQKRDRKSEWVQPDALDADAIIRIIEAGEGVSGIWTAMGVNPYATKAVKAARRTLEAEHGEAQVERWIIKADQIRTSMRKKQEYQQYKASERKPPRDPDAPAMDFDAIEDAWASALAGKAYDDKPVRDGVFTRFNTVPRPATRLHREAIS